MTDEHTSHVGRHFAQEWHDYDQCIRNVVPYYDDALNTLINVASHFVDQPGRILDLGVGTGILAERMLHSFPDASVSGIDLVPDFLEQARNRLEHHAPRVSLKCGDVRRGGLPDDCDLVVSSFMIHHLEDDAKRQLYRCVHSALRPAGFFVNLDFVDSASRLCSRIFDELRIAHMRAAGLEEATIRTAYIGHRKLERPAPMEVQVSWLKDLGFVDTECYWKYLNLAMFGGRKRRNIAKSPAKTERAD